MFSNPSMSSLHFTSTRAWKQDLVLPLWLHVPATTSTLRFLVPRNLLVREPSVCLHQSYGIVFQIPSRMLQAWTLSKLNWNLIYIHINLCFPFLALFCLYFSCIFILFVVLYFSALHPPEKALYKCRYFIVLYCYNLSGCVMYFQQPKRQTFCYLSSKQTLPLRQKTMLNRLNINSLNDRHVSKQATDHEFNSFVCLFVCLFVGLFVCVFYYYSAWLSQTNT